MPSTSLLNGVMSNEINPPEVLSNRNVVRSNNVKRNKKQQGRENKTLKLSGNVDLGKNVFKPKTIREKNATKKNAKPTPASQSNTISEIFPPNHHRHNHYEKPKIIRKVPTQNPVTYRPKTSTRAIFIQPTTSPRTSVVDNTTMSEMATKHLEKVINC